MISAFNNVSPRVCDDIYIIATNLMFQDARRI